MFGHAIVLIGIHVVFEAIRSSSALKVTDISSLLEKLQGNDEKYNDARDYRAHEHNDKGYITLNSLELDELIDRVAQDVYYQNKNVYNPLQETRNKKGSIKYDDPYNRNVKQFQKRSKKISHNNVLSNRGENPNFDNVQTLNDKDNIYVVLNPGANINENDLKNIIGLLPRLAPDIASKKIYAKQDRTRMNDELRYKGFVIANGRRARRWFKGSKELRAQPESLEDYKPKRVRSEYGGAGGRTPIPYIRHRDIYERE